MTKPHQQNHLAELHQKYQNELQEGYYQVHKIETDSGPIELSMAQIKDFLVDPGANVTPQELMMFLKLCQHQKLNPFIKDAYLIKFGNQPASMVVSKDVAFKRAFANPNYDGMESGVVVMNKESGQLDYRKGTLYLKAREELVGAWATVYRKDITRPTEVVVNFEEFVQKKKDGTVNANWTNRPAVMIHKVAESTALRKAFPETHQGMYDESEVDSPSQSTYQQSAEQMVPPKAEPIVDKVSYANRPQKQQQEVIDYSSIATEDASHLL